MEKTSLTLFALRKTKIVYNFGLSEYIRVYQARQLLQTAVLEKYDQDIFCSPVKLLLPGTGETNQLALNVKTTL